MDALLALQSARDLLRDTTPLVQDCGRFCGGACCQSDEDGQGGMLLFPGEEKFYPVLPEGFSIVEDNAVAANGKLLLCPGQCRREDRPLACRLFPLLPTRQGCCLDQRGWAVCPLMDHGKAGLRREFLCRVEEAGRILYACREHAAFLDALHAFNQRLKQF